jgi:hypothetical protein
MTYQGAQEQYRWSYNCSALAVIGIHAIEPAVTLVRIPLENAKIAVPN